MKNICSRFDAWTSNTAVNRHLRLLALFAFCVVGAFSVIGIFAATAYLFGGWGILVLIGGLFYTGAYKLIKAEEEGTL